MTPLVILAQGWSFWKGPKDGDGLSGEEERDKVSMNRKEVDFNDEVDFLDRLAENEISISGEEKIVRLKKLGRMIYGLNVFLGLWLDYDSYEDKSESVLGRLRQGRGMTHVDFLGDVLRNPDGKRCGLQIYLDDDGSCRENAFLLDSYCGVHDLSAVAKQASE